MKSINEVLTLDYQLAELPSSQHRAGLAGLVLVIQWLERQPGFNEKVANGTICKFTKIEESGATLELNQMGVEALFDEIYAASTEEQERNQLLKNSRTKEIIEPLREEERQETTKDGKKKTKKVFIYPVVVPKGSFLADSSFDKSFKENKGHWIKLWRDVVWSIIRGLRTTKEPYEKRAKGEYNKDAQKVWEQLIKSEEFTVDLPSTYFLGAQANNAENIAFKDRARFQFLLHFWLFAAQIYVPQIINNEGSRDFVGYALAIPDIAYLVWFCEELSAILKERGCEISGYRPRDCIVDLAIESALHMMTRLSEQLTTTIGERTGITSTVFGIDVIHTKKQQGNKIRLLSVTRLSPEDSMINRYSQIRENYWSPLFRKQRLLNLVNHSPWYQGYDSLLCTLSFKEIINNDYFKRDVREAIKNEANPMNTETTQSTNIEQLVFNLIQAYVLQKLDSKYNLKWQTIQKTHENKEEATKDYSEKKSKIARTAFLDVRSRSEKMDFINYFVSSLCSVPQHMNSENFVALTRALYEDTDRIRTLTLLALSANG